MDRPQDGVVPWNSDEHIEHYQSLFPILPDYVAHYTIGGKRFPRIGLPDKSSLRFAKDILSVLIAYRLQISVPWAKKRYVRDVTGWQWLGLTERIDTLFSTGREGLGTYVSFGHNFEKTEGSFQDLSIQFFYRNLAALDAAKRLSELGYLCEVATILRMALEQFAFAGRLWSWPGDEKIENVRPTESLQHLKRFVPASGRLYGLLSKYTHFEYDHHTHFFQISSKEIFTIQQDSVLRAYATHLLFLTMVCISRYVLQLSKTQFGEVPKSVGDLAQFVKDVHIYSDDVCNMLRSTGSAIKAISNTFLP